MDRDSDIDGRAPALSPEQRRAVEQLSPQRKACLRLASYRLRHAEIAHQLGLAPDTVKTYLAQARDALGGVNTLRAAAMLAAVEGPAPPPKGVYPTPGLTEDPAPGAGIVASSGPAVPPRLELREMRQAYLPEIEQPAEAIAASPLRRGLALPPGFAVLAISVGITIALAMTVIFGAAVLTSISLWLGSLSGR